MSAGCCTKAGGVRRSAAWALPTAMLIAVPKCPMCLAAYFALVTGVGMSVETAGWVRMGVIVASVAMLVALVTRALVRTIRRDR